MTTTSFRGLMAEAHRLGVNVQLAHIEDPHIEAHYDCDTETITLDLALTISELKVAFGHELGHAQRRDTCSTPTNEARADRYAAQLLIDVNDYRRAERIDSDPQAIADELGVTRHLVRVFQKQILPALSLRRGA